MPSVHELIEWINNVIRMYAWTTYPTEHIIFSNTEMHGHLSPKCVWIFGKVTIRFRFDSWVFHLIPKQCSIQNDSGFKIDHHLV